jgi:hypothetical protein
MQCSTACTLVVMQAPRDPIVTRASTRTHRSPATGRTFGRESSTRETPANSWSTAGNFSSCGALFFAGLTCNAPKVRND